MAPPNRRNPVRRETKRHPDVFSNHSTQGKTDPPAPAGAAGRANEVLENHHSDDYNSQDDDREEDEEEKEGVEEAAEEEREKEEKKKEEDNAEWHWQCHLCAHLNALPRLYRDFSAVPPCISQPCGNTDVLRPEPSYGPLRLRGPEPRSWEVRTRSRGNSNGGCSGSSRSVDDRRSVRGGGIRNVGGGGGGDSGVAWKSAHQKLLEAEDGDGLEGAVMGLSSGVSGTGGSTSVSISTTTSKSKNTSTCPPPSTQCPHRRCEGCYDIDARMRVVRFCGSGSGGSGTARLYAQWRAGFGFVEPGFDPPVVIGGLGQDRGRGSGEASRNREASGERETRTSTKNQDRNRNRDQNHNRTRVEGLSFTGVGGAGSGDEGRFIRGGVREEETRDGGGSGSGSKSGSEIGDATEIPRLTEGLVRTQMQHPRTRSPARYVAGESRILLIRSTGERSGGDERNDDDGHDDEYNSPEDEAGKASSDEGEGFFGEHGNGDHDVGEGSSSDGAISGLVAPVTLVHRGSQEGGGCSESESGEEREVERKTEKKKKKEEEEEEEEDEKKNTEKSKKVEQRVIS